MRAFESWVLEYLLNSLWQVPLVFVAALAAARLARSRGPHLEHRIWVGALLLSVSLPACSLRPAALWQQLSGLFPWWGGGAAHGEVRVLIGPAVASQGGVLRLPVPLLDALLLAYAGTLLYFAGRLVWGLWNTYQLRRHADRLTLTGEAAQSWARAVRLFGIGSARLAVSFAVVGPVTVGVKRRMVLLPPRFLERVSGPDLDAVFAHEFAHMRRYDFARNLFYGVLALPVAFHPLLWLLRARVTESRELLCDAIAAQAVQGRQRYARSLLRLASMLAHGTAAPTLQAVGIFNGAADAHTLERRVMNLTRKRTPMGAARRLVITAAVSFLAFTACGSALALRMNVGAQSADAPAHTPKKISVKSDVMSGQKISGQDPEYPKAARAAKIQGTVVLDATIDKQGAVTGLHVIKSPDKALSASAMEAVRTWRYKPYLLNGEPIAVDTTVNVTYNLGG